MDKIKVGILGATGIVGQRFVQLLENHPWFEISELVASEQSAGKNYAQACKWQLPTPMPEGVKSINVKTLNDDLHCRILFSALNSTVAGKVEAKFAASGFAVISNASAFRMEDDVPLLIPEVNPEHLNILSIQKKNRGFSNGFIVTNPNCSTIPLAMILHALEQNFSVKKVIATTMQAISGAGYPGLPSLDILGNVIPHIAGEEEKIQTETKKILGQISQAAISPADILISAQVNRVPVQDGHLLSLSVELAEKTTIDNIETALSSFRSLPQELNLPTAPANPIIVLDQKDRPQPKLDATAGNGMSVVAGNIRPCPVLDFKMTILAHNTIRGAAGAAILNAELVKVKGYV